MTFMYLSRMNGVLDILNAKNLKKIIKKGVFGPICGENKAFEAAKLGDDLYNLSMYLNNS